MVFGSLWDFSKFVRLEYKSSTTKILEMIKINKIETV